jgi:uncharacterized small protein (DUF1192 family)
METIVVDKKAMIREIARSTALDLAMDGLKHLKERISQLEAENARLENRLRNRNDYAFSQEMGRVKVSEQLLKMGYLLTADNNIVERKQ